MTVLTKYAEALFLLSEEEGVTDTVREDLATVNLLIKESPDYAKILDTPALSKDERTRLIDEAFGGLNEYVSNLIKMLCIEHNVYAFPRLYADFMRLYNDKLGIVEVEAISATALTAEQRARIKEKLEKKLSKTVTVSNTVDESILGGLILRYDSLQLDGSVKTRLEKIERGLKSAVI